MSDEFGLSCVNGWVGQVFHLLKVFVHICSLFFYFVEMFLPKSLKQDKFVPNTLLSVVDYNIGWRKVTHPLGSCT